MAAPWTFTEHVDARFSQPHAVEEYLRRSGVTADGERRRLESWRIDRNDTVLELGCGPGILAIEAARICRHVTAVDPSAAMLNHARTLAEWAGITNITFVQAGFLTYQHAGEPADVIVSVRALHHLPDFWKAQALTRLHAMLRPGGTLHLSDLVYSFDPPAADRAIAAWIGAAANRDAGSPRTFFEDHVRNEHSTYTWILESILRKVGFEILDASYDPRQTYATYTCGRRES